MLTKDWSRNTRHNPSNPSNTGYNVFKREIKRRFGFFLFFSQFTNTATHSDGRQTKILQAKEYFLSLEFCDESRDGFAKLLLTSEAQTVIKLHHIALRWMHDELQ